MVEYWALRSALRVATRTYLHVAQQRGSQAATSQEASPSLLDQPATLMVEAKPEPVTACNKKRKLMAVWLEAVFPTVP